MVARRFALLIARIVQFFASVVKNANIFAGSIPSLWKITFSYKLTNVRRGLKP